MTVHEIYERGIEKLPAMERLRLATLILERLTESAEAQRELGEAWAEQINRVTLPNRTLLQLAAKHQPADAWWDASDDPFTEQDK